MTPDPTPQILRVRYTGGNYIAANLADLKQSVSCTMGEEIAARRWIEKFTKAVPPGDARPATDAELADVDRSKDKPGVYYFTWDVREAAPMVADPIELETEAAPATPAAPEKAARPTLQLPLALIDLHPALDRIMLLPDAAAALGDLQNGDKAKRERFEGLTVEWSAWVDEIRENGIRETIKVIPAGGRYLAIEGRHRITAGREAGLETAPCELSDESELLSLAEGTVRGRRHWTKSQRAFFAVIMHPEIATGDRRGSFGNGRSAKNADLKGGLDFSAEGLAARYGVSTRLIELAIELYRGLETHPSARARIEPALWSGVGLADAINGLKALESGLTNPGSSNPKLPTARLRKAWDHETAGLSNWDTFTDDQRAMLADDLAAAAKKMPAGYLAWKLEILNTIAAEGAEA